MSPSSNGSEAKAVALPLREYEGWDATAMAALIRDGQLTPLEVLDAAIARAEARAGAGGLNAISHRHHELARPAARQLAGLGQAELAHRAANAPLLGVPFLLKDLGLALKGTATSHGCAFFQDAVADHDSTLVQRYQAAGLNIFGKTTSPEFGQTATTESRLYGCTPNPWNCALSSGGSSGGAAVAVAAGVLPVAHASDGGGSIRIPASHCGLFGLKPSRGRLPSGPRLLEGWMGSSTHHVISRSVHDSALLLQLTQGAERGSRTAPPPDDMLGALRPRPHTLRIGLLETNPFGLPVHPDCLEAARRAAALCEALGHHIEPVALPLPPALVGEMFAGMGVVTTSGLLASVRAREGQLGRAVRESELEAVSWGNLDRARGHCAEQLLAARASFDQVGRLFDLFFAGHDPLLSPVTAAPPPPLGVMSPDLPYDDYAKAAVMASPFTAMFNMSGHPALSVPLHWKSAGLPLGVPPAAVSLPTLDLFPIH